MDHNFYEDIQSPLLSIFIEKASFGKCKQGVEDAAAALTEFLLEIEDSERFEGNLCLAYTRNFHGLKSELSEALIQLARYRCIVQSDFNDRLRLIHSCIPLLLDDEAIFRTILESLTSVHAS